MMRSVFVASEAMKSRLVMGEGCRSPLNGIAEAFNLGCRKCVCLVFLRLVRNAEGRRRFVRFGFFMQAFSVFD